MLFTSLLASLALGANGKFLTSVRDGYPAPAPDGRSLVFQSNRNGRGALWISAIDGSAPRAARVARQRRRSVDSQLVA